MREERLRTTAGLRGVSALPLSAWRGRSGRRYVVGVHSLGEAELDEIGAAVVIAVRRDKAGIAELLSVATSGESPREHLHRNWLARVRQRGATEMHVHRLAEDAQARAAVVEDLATESADSVACA